MNILSMGMTNDYEVAIEEEQLWFELELVSLVQGTIISDLIY